MSFSEQVSELCCISELKRNFCYRVSCGEFTGVVGSNLDIQVSDEKVLNLLLTNCLESLEPTESVMFQGEGDLLTGIPWNP